MDVSDYGCRKNSVVHFFHTLRANVRVGAPAQPICAEMVTLTR